MCTRTEGSRRTLDYLTYNALGIAILRANTEAAVRAYLPDGFNVGLNDGPAAGQTVCQLHVHVIPRYKGDVSDPRGGVRWILPSKRPLASDKRFAGHRAVRADPCRTYP